MTTITDFFTRHGFEVEHVGGGCELLAKYAPDGSHVWISGADGTDLPTESDWMICYYPADYDGEDILFAVTTEDAPEGFLSNVLNAAIARLEGRDTTDTLTTEFGIVLTNNPDLPRLSADELLHHDLTPFLRRYVSEFVTRWDAAAVNSEVRL